MREDSIIDIRIAAILAGSGLPLERRVEVADELRSHLEQLIAAKHNAGLTGEQAVQAALTDFGPPDVIRTQLKKQQKKLDRRHALTEFRRVIWWLLTGCGLFALLCTITAPARFAAGPLFLASACLFVCVLIIMSVPIYLAELLSLQIQRRRPIAEYSFLKSFLRYAVVVLGYLSLTLAMGPFVVGIVGYIGQNSLFESIPRMAPEVVVGAPWLFWRNFGIVAWDSPIRSFVVPALMVIVSAVVIAFYERSRCVGNYTDCAFGRP